MSPNSQLPRVRAASFETSKSLAAGPPALWRKWPALLERTARLTTAPHGSWAGRLAERVSNADFWSRGSVRSLTPPAPRARAGLLGGLERGLIRWSHQVERHPVRMFGVGATFAFVLGVLVGLL